MSDRTPYALVSVSDKTGIAEFAQGLVDRGFAILSTGGTADHLASEGIEVRRVGVRFEGRRAARPEDVFLVDEREVGSVTSGAFAPSLGDAVAMGYVETDFAEPGQTMQAAVRSHRIAGEVVDLPFYREGTATIDLSKGELP